MTTVFLLLAAFPQDESLLEKFEREVGRVVRRGRPSVVMVVGRVLYQPTPRITIHRRLSLSGVVYRKDGYIVTAADPIREAEDLRVRLADHRELPAAVVGLDRKTGIAVLKVEAINLSPVELADGAAFRSGTIAIIIGNPFGLRGAASVGYVSGDERSIFVSGRRYDGMLQLTTPSHPGDCGGLVADARGRLIGMVNSAYRSEEGEDLFGLWKRFGRRSRGLLGESWDGISFAIPADQVRFVADRIIKMKRMVRGWIGVTARTAPDGVVLTQVVSGGPADRAGLRIGDVLHSFDGREVRSVRILQAAVEKFTEPHTVRVVRSRGGMRSEVQVSVKVETGGHRK